MPGRDPFRDGANIVSNRASDIVDALESNPTIIVAPVNAEADKEPTLDAMPTMAAVFDKYAPKLPPVNIKNFDGSTTTLPPIGINSIPEFSVESIVERVAPLREQKEHLAAEIDLRQQLKESPLLRGAVGDVGERDRLIAILEKVQRLLEGTKR